MEELIKNFQKTGLTAVQATKPFGSLANRDVFGITILRKLKGNLRSEYFSIWPGHKDNIIQVVNIDSKLQQLVLMVKEPRREVKHKSFRVPPKEARNIVKTKSVYEFSLFTSDAKRHFLVGVDERQLFMAQLPRGVTTVKDAHKSLKTTSVTLAEGKVAGRTIRQGEWFFLNVTKEEKETIRTAIKDNKAVIRRKIALGAVLGGGGKPHTADELVILPASMLEHGFSVQQRDNVFIRGKVRHADHKTVSFAEWRKVIRNAESRAQSFGNWFD